MFLDEILKLAIGALAILGIDSDDEELRKKKTIKVLTENDYKSLI